MFERFFIYLSGADFQILKDLPSSERNKFISLGVTILFTGILASLSSGYAFYQVFHELNVSLIMGILWGFMILNLDRYIVMSIRKRNNKWEEFTTAIPRIILAVIISLVVAKPLEVRIFEDRIAVNISDNKLKQLESNKTRINSIIGKEIIDSLKNKNELAVGELEIRLNANCPTEECQSTYSAMVSAFADYENLKGRVSEKINDLEKNIRFLQNDERFKITHIVDSIPKTELTQEAKIQILRYRKSMDAYIQERKRAYNDYLVIKKNYDSMNTQYMASMREKLINAENELDEIAVAETSADSLRKSLMQETNLTANRAYTENFITQIEALEQLTSWQKDEISATGEVTKKANNSMFWINILIILLFVVIETAPVFVRLLTPGGLYEERLNMLQEELLTYSIVKNDLAKAYHQRRADLELKIEMLQNDKLTKLLELTSDEQVLELKKMNTNVVDDVKSSVERNDYPEAINLLFEFVDRNRLNQYEKKIINLGAKLKFIEKNMNQDTIEPDFGLKQKANLTNDLIQLASEIQKAK